jgi:hypothetical protein
MSGGEEGQTEEISKVSDRVGRKIRQDLEQKVKELVTI